MANNMSDGYELIFQFIPSYTDPLQERFKDTVDFRVHGTRSMQYTTTGDFKIVSSRNRRASTQFRKKDLNLDSVLIDEFRKYVGPLNSNQKLPKYLVDQMNKHGENCHGFANPLLYFTNTMELSKPYFDTNGRSLFIKVIGEMKENGDPIVRIGDVFSCRRVVERLRAHFGPLLVVFDESNCVRTLKEIKVLFNRDLTRCYREEENNWQDNHFFTIKRMSCVK